MTNLHVPSRDVLYEMANNNPDLTEDLELLFEGSLAPINSLKSGQFVFISQKSDFPSASNGVIKLPANTSYYVTALIDLTGDRLEAEGIVSIVSSSPEIGKITSTGLSASTPLLTSAHTIALNNVGFFDSDYVLSLDGVAGDYILDWHGVNFINCPKIGEIKDYGNATFNLLGIIDSANLTFDGTFGTLKFTNSLFSGIAAQTTIFILSTAIITRRIDIFDSALVAFAGATALDVSTSITIPDESYIIESCNFSGGATFTAGLQYDDNKSHFVDNNGITNSTQEASYYMLSNAVPTPISSGTPTKILGTTTENPLTERFVHTDNRATYTAAITRKFIVHVTAALSSNNNNVLYLFVAKNGVVIDQSRATGTANAGGKAEGIFTMALVELQTDNYIEMWVDNNTGNNAITDVDLNVIITESI